MKNLILILTALLTVWLTLRPLRWGKFSLNMVSGSLMFFFLLLVTGTVSIAVVKDALLGTPHFAPWKIIVIFFSVAYVSISTDITGVFDYIAFQTAKMFGASGFGLFTAFYLIASIMTIFTSNDIVILTLTPIIFYLSKHRQMDVLPLLFAQFFAANTASMLLLIGNPTNIIIALALKIDFRQFLTTMWLPTLVALVSNYLLLIILFRKRLAGRNELSPGSLFEVRSRANALICSFLMLLMLVALIYSEKLGFEIWFVTGGSALLFFILNTIFGIYYLVKGKKLTKAQLEIGRIVYNLKTDRVRMWVAMRRMPWKILPFVLTFFVIVHALETNGFVASYARFLSGLITTPFASVIVTGFSGFITANIMNNQPMSILYAKTLLNPQFALEPNLLRLAVFSSIIASNLSANLTLIGALAGLMWTKILQEKGIKISYLSFLKYGIIITPLTLLITLIVLLVI
jgi:arsenical pump membrane protein